jgi:hypothetical protein
MLVIIVNLPVYIHLLNEALISSVETKKKTILNVRCLESWTKEKGGQLSQALSLQQGILCIGMKKNFKVSLNFNTQHVWLRSNP